MKTLSRFQSIRVSGLACILIAVLCTPAFSAELHDHSSHGHGENADQEHETLHFSHPLVSESPSPDTKIRLNYAFAEGEEEDGEDVEEQEIEVEVEYAFNRAFSVEVVVPYVHVDVDGMPNESNLDNIRVGMKFANFEFEDQGLLLGYGLEFGLPTGDDSEGIGSNHLFEIEPNLNFGYKRGKNELVGFTSFGIPVNQSGGEETETEMGFNLSLLRHVTPRFEALIELDGGSVLSGPEDGFTVVNLTPGVKVRPFKDHPLDVGLGFSFPITNDEDFDTRTLLSVFYHF